MDERLSKLRVTFKEPQNERLDNVRLSIDIQGLKTALWEKAEGTPFDDLMPEAPCENAVC